MISEEIIAAGNKARADYHDSIRAVMAKRRIEADKARRLTHKEIRENPEKCREEFKKMLGWPLTDYDKEIPTAEWTLLGIQEDKEIYRVILSLPIGISFYGIYFKHTGTDKRPLVIFQHGGMGTPEFCMGITDRGSGYYHEAADRLFSRGVNVFAPGLLLWNTEKYGPEFKDSNITETRSKIDAELKQVGSSITAIEIYSIMKTIDYLSTQPETDTERIGMTGLSYGGFFTDYTTAIDTRIKTAFSTGQFSNRYENVFTDWTWTESAYKFFDVEVASLIYPRPLFIEIGKRDYVFNYETTVREVEELKSVYGKDNEWVKFELFDGDHVYPPTNELLDKFIDALYN